MYFCCKIKRGEKCYITKAVNISNELEGIETNILAIIKNCHFQGVSRGIFFYFQGVDTFSNFFKGFPGVFQGAATFKGFSRGLKGFKGSVATLYTL